MDVCRGKFGSVRVCVEMSTGHTFAAKFIRLRTSARRPAMTAAGAAVGRHDDDERHEVAVMNVLRHPKILLLWDAFETPRELILVMEQCATICVYSTTVQ